MGSLTIGLQSEKIWILLDYESLKKSLKIFQQYSDQFLISM